MRKITLMMMVALSVATVSSSFATDKTKPKAKKAEKCHMGGSCCKKTSKADMLKAMPVKATAKRA
jgi:hypothetical protein